MPAHRKDVAYQGSANYESWNVALWLSNDEGMYNACVKLAQNRKNPNGLGRALKRYVGEGRFGDLTVHEMRRVRWEDVARTFLEE